MQKLIYNSQHLQRETNRPCYLVSNICLLIKYLFRRLTLAYSLLFLFTDTLG